MAHDENVVGTIVNDACDADLAKCTSHHPYIIVPTTLSGRVREPAAEPIKEEEN